MKWKRTENDTTWSLSTLTRLIFFFVIIIFSHATNAQQLSEYATVSILSCAPGDDIYSIYGHSAVRVKDSSIGFDVVYNYGTFDFDEPGFYWNFLRGKLFYKIGKSTTQRFVEIYDYNKRGVKEQVLNLDNSECQSYFDFLEDNYRPENREYLYDFFYDNCATRITDLVYTENAVLPQIFMPEDSLTFRMLIKRYHSENPWYDLGVDLILGAPADKIASLRETTFLPDYLHGYLHKMTTSKADKLVTKENILLSFDKAQQTSGMPPFWVFLTLSILEIILLLMFIKKSNRWVIKYDIFWFFLCSLGSLILLFMWFGTDHQACSYNWNLLWLSPFYLLPFIGLMINSNPMVKIGCWTIIILTLFSGIGSFFIPQKFNLIVLMLSGICFLKCLRLIFVLKRTSNKA